MELDEMRSDWKRISATADPDAIQRLDTRKGNIHSPVRRMLRNLRIETILMLVTYPIITIVYFFGFRGYMQEISWFTLTIGIIFSIYYYRKNKLLRSLEDMGGSVHDALEGKIHSLDSFMHFYLWAGTALGPITIGFIGWLTWKKLPEIDPHNPFFVSTENPLVKVVLAWIFSVVLVTVVFFILNKWYIQMLYGKHINKLRSILEDMQEEERINLPS